MTRRRWWPRLLLLVAALVVADQAAQYGLLHEGTLLGRRIAPYDPPLFSPEQWALRAKLRAVVEGRASDDFIPAHDAELGWLPRPSLDHQRFDWAGGRIGRGPLARTKRDGVLRVVAVGCSFTYGEEVEDHQTWTAQLEALRADVEVCNLGVSAYGTDQALLRYRRDGARLDPDEVWLGFTPVTLGRLSSIYRPAERHWTNFLWLKPRFVLDEEGGLVLLSNPGTSLPRTLELLSDQDLFLAAVGEHDRWVRRAPTAYARQGASLLHASAVGRLLLTLHEVSGRPQPTALLEDGSAPATRLLAALVRTLARETAAAGAVLRLVVLPSREDLIHGHARGALPSSAPVLQGLAAGGVAVTDVTAALEAVDAREDAAAWMPGGHYAPGTHRVVAEALAALPGAR